MLWKKDIRGTLLENGCAVRSDNEAGHEIFDARTGQTISRFDPKDFPEVDPAFSSLSCDGRLLAAVKGSTVTVWESQFADFAGRSWFKMIEVWMGVLLSICLTASVWRDRMYFRSTTRLKRALG